MLSLKKHALSGKPRATEAFTLIELIIVVTIVLILAATAISQTGSIRNLLTFNNTFEQVVFMVQRARTQALTQQQGLNEIGIDFSETDKIKLVSFTDTPTPTPLVIEEFTFPENIHVNVHRETIPCEGDTYIFFENGTARTHLRCADSESYSLASGATLPITSLEVIVCQISSVSTGSPCSGSPIRRKSFTIHRAAGVPQFNP